jgi:hypothetical protein
MEFSLNLNNGTAAQRPGLRHRFSSGCSFVVAPKIKLGTAT